MMAATELTVEQAKAWATARYIVMESAPYLARIVLTLRPYCPPVLGVAHVDPSGVCYLSTDVLEGPPPDVARWIAHAVWHLLRSHADRLAGCDDRMLAGLCGCLEVNDDFADDMRVGPHPHDLNQPSGLMAETYYRALDQTGDAHEGECGAGSGAESDPWAVDDGYQPDMATIAAVVAEAILNQPPGTVPGNLTVWAGGVIRAPKVCWQDQLAGFIGSVGGVASGRDDWSMSRPARRQRDGTVPPGMIRAEPRCGVVVDTSGSMGANELDSAVAEVTGIIDAAGVDILLCSCDYDASSPSLVGAVGSLVGGGGTDMTAGIAAVLSVIGDPVDVVVVVTDGFTPWPAVPIGVPLVVVLVGNEDTSGVPSWASVVVVPR